MTGTVWSFDYTNHRGDDHRYVVDFAAGHRPGAGEHEGQPVLSGNVITRDGDYREGVERRRTFVLAGMRNVEVVA